MGGGAKVERRATFDTFFLYEKNLVHGRFVERNTACLIRCGTFQISDRELGVWAGCHCLPLTHHRTLGTQLHIGLLRKTGQTAECPHSHFFLTFLLLPQLHPFPVGGERFKTFRTCYGPISIHL